MKMGVIIYGERKKKEKIEPHLEEFFFFFFNIKDPER